MLNYLQQYQILLNLTPDGKIGPNTAKAMMADLGITDKLVFAHVMAQVAHESGGFSHFRENMNYSAAGLLNIFGEYYKPFPGLAEKHARNSEAIGNHVYANRMGNGDEASGDGYFYRGTFSLQTTGKDNHLELFEFCGLPPDTNPDDLKDNYKVYFQSAFFWFKKNGVDKLCKSSDADCVKKVSRRVNGGDNGLKDRQSQAKIMFKAVGVT
jgi:putative chitinase